MYQIDEQNGPSGLFSMTREASTVIIRFSNCPFYNCQDLMEKQNLHNCLDQISADEEVKSVLLFGPPEQKSCDRFFQACRQSVNSLDAKMTLARFQNAISQGVRKIASLNKFVIHVDQRDSIPLYMNLGLACDYRIIRKDALFHTRNLEMGYIPNGGEVFFLSKLIGHKKTTETLFLRREIPAKDALDMELVNETVTKENLDAAAFRVARQISNKPGYIISSLKSLIRFAEQGLKANLERENSICTRLVNSMKFKDISSCSL